MLKPGMTILRRDGLQILIQGRNQCHPWMWWGWRIQKDGKANKNSMPLVTREEIIAVKNENGFQTMLPGML